MCIKAPDQEGFTLPSHGIYQKALHNKDAFVIMPFSQTATCSKNEWTEIFDNVFRPAIEECGYSCERAKPMTGSLMGTITDKLRHAQIVVADVTDRNPNVFYELGVRHCLRKGTIIVSQGEHHIPSDLRGYWFINYGIRPAEVVQFKAAIRRLISEIEMNPDNSDNPISDYLDKEHISISSYVQRENVKKLTALYTELTGNLLAIGELSRNTYDRNFVSYDCLKLLLQTLYVDIGPELLKVAYELQQKLRSIEGGNNDSSFLAVTVSEIRLLAKETLDLRNKIALDQFREPSTISTMIWQPPGGIPANRLVLHASCETALPGLNLG
jgi:hypothetical protein